MGCGQESNIEEITSQIDAVLNEAIVDTAMEVDRAPATVKDTGKPWIERKEGHLTSGKSRETGGMFITLGIRIDARTGVIGLFRNRLTRVEDDHGKIGLLLDNQSRRRGSRNHGWQGRGWTHRFALFLAVGKKFRGHMRSVCTSRESWITDADPLQRSPDRD